MARALTLEAALDSRLHAAVRTTNRNIITGWSRRGQHIESPDERFTREFAFEVVEKSLKGKRSLRRICFPDHERMAGLIRDRVLTGGGLIDPVVEVIIHPKGEKPRTLMIASYPDRVGQAAIADAVNRHLERAGFFHDGCHGFRRKRGVLSALCHARSWMRRDYRIAHAKDIRKFYPSIGANLIDMALASVEHLLAPDLLDFLRGAFTRVVVRSRRGDRRGPNALFLGAPISPLLSNIVGTLLVDRVVAEFGAVVIHTRYADDILLLVQRDPGLALAVERAIGRRLADEGLALHPEKGTSQPIDLDHQPLKKYLGLALHGKKIVVPEDVIVRATRALREAPRHELRATASNLMGQLRFLKQWRRRKLVDTLVGEGLDRNQLGPLLEARRLRDPAQGQGPSHLEVRHREAIEAHAAVAQLGFPGIG
jgi:hypothetical protein